jgi:CubicO group peptidase (beta-lactamase class C family)
MQGFAENEDFNSEGWRSGQVGSGQGHGNARAIARHFAMLAGGGTLENVMIMSHETCKQAITFQCESDGVDPIIGSPVRFALGYELNNETFPMGPNPRAFGHWGAGGSFGLGDADANISFGYTPNHMQQGMELGARGGALVAALFDCL